MCYVVVFQSNGENFGGTHELSTEMVQVSSWREVAVDKNARLIAPTTRSQLQLMVKRACVSRLPSPTTFVT